MKKITVDFQRVSEWFDETTSGGLMSFCADEFLVVLGLTDDYYGGDRIIRVTIGTSKRTRDSPKPPASSPTTIRA